MIYYFGYYTHSIIEDEKRISFSAAVSKMDYVIYTINQNIGETINVISASETKKDEIVKGKLSVISDKVKLRTFTSLWHNNKMIRVIARCITKMDIYFYLIRTLSSKDTLIVYHSLALMRMVKLIKKITKCKLILEVEEIYSDVMENEKMREKELDYFLIADCYICITKNLEKQINRLNKPCVICHGTYRTNDIIAQKTDDNKIHLVYAGTFDPIKGGVFLAIESAQYLSDNYVLNILGKGSKKEEKEVLKKIEEMKSIVDCSINFIGFKNGVEFDKFIQSCHIGLSTQQPYGKYNDSSFPSKILMYMSNGLDVVSIKIPAVAESQIGKYIHYYEDNLPISLANAIKQINSKKESRNILDNLHDKFVKELKGLIEGGLNE